MPDIIDLISAEQFKDCDYFGVEKHFGNVLLMAEIA